MTESEVAAASPASTSEPTHCPYRRVSDLLQRLSPGKMRVALFVGAGCPLSIRIKADGGATAPLIPDISGLTASVRKQLEADKAINPIAEQAWDRLKTRGISNPNVEHLLSHIRTLKSLCGDGSVDGFTKEDLNNLDSAICSIIRSIVDKDHSDTKTPYHALASWIQAIPRDRPVEIFSTNYDLLLEQALEDVGVPYFDGFVGSHTAFLDHEAFEKDDLPTRWTRFWKLHGSVNWWLTGEAKVRRSRDEIKGEQLLIYPSHLKYDQSRKMPYYSMFDRLRTFFRSDQCFIITIGYSFADEHINDYIAQGLKGNPNAACFAMVYNDLADAPNAVALAKKHANLSVLACDGAIIGTVMRNWHTNEKDDGIAAYPISVSKEVDSWRTKAPKDRCKWLLGDFAAFGQFLTNQLSSREAELGGRDA